MNSDELMARYGTRLALFGDGEVIPLASVERKAALAEAIAEALIELADGAVTVH
jgi:hypothetical protein